MSQPIRTLAPKRYWNEDVASDSRKFVAVLDNNITVSSGTPKEIVWDRVLANSLTSYNALTGALTINESGVYEVSVQLSFLPNGAGSTRSIYVDLNGLTTWTTAGRQVNTPGEVRETLIICHRDELLAGDVITIFANINGGVDCSVSGQSSILVRKLF